MKRHVGATLLLVVLIVGMLTFSVNASQSRVASCTASLSFNGATASCATVCRGDTTKDMIDVTMTLYDGNTVIDAWSGAGIGNVFLSKEETVSRGRTYHLDVVYYINGVKQPLVSESKYCS